MEWSLMDAGSGWTFQLLNEPILPLLESTWDVPRTAVAVVEEAAAEVVVDHHVASQGTTTEATTGVMTEVMTVTTIAMTTGSTVHTDADLHLRTTAEGTALDLDHGPTPHVTTEQQEKSQQQCYCLDACFSLF